MNKVTHTKPAMADMASSELYTEDRWPEQSSEKEQDVPLVAFPLSRMHLAITLDSTYDALTLVLTE